MKTLTHLDLFSGIGGFALAAEKAGFKTIGFCEIDPFCSKALSKHWPNIKNHRDIKTLQMDGPVDLITGGFPCQPFSVAGKKKGKDDERYLWPEFLRAIKQCKPTWVVAENVAGIVEMELDNILDDLENEGYETQSFIIPACGANAPHRRDRIWIVAHSNRKRCDKREHHRKERQIPKDFDRHLSQIQSEWEKFKPEPWKIMQAGDYLEINSHVSRIDDGIPNWMDRVKSLGNAIVPQVTYPILAMINMIENAL